MDNLSSIIESAPLTNTLIIPLSLTITVSLFLSEENSISCNLSISFLNKPSLPNLILLMLDEPDSIKLNYL